MNFSLQSSANIDIYERKNGVSGLGKMRKRISVRIRPTIVSCLTPMLPTLPTDPYPPICAAHTVHTR